MIDTHCHLDLYPHPEKIAESIEANRITTVAVTNLPSHFAFSQLYVKPYKHIHLALGLHPLIPDSYSAKEWESFRKASESESYIGEVGLDFSTYGRDTAQKQLGAFHLVLEAIQNRPRFISLHSRGAEEKVGELLELYHIKMAVFHWYSGPLCILDDLVQKGFYFSINPGMISSKKGQTIITHIPKEQLLTETDGPYLQVQNRSAQPTDIRLVLVYISHLWNTSVPETEKLIEKNYRKMINFIKSAT